MGAVYEAEHVEIGKRVAIKLVRSIHARHTEIAARFKREARSASAIESDHIVQVFDAGNDPELGLFMAMEMLRGEDLGTLLTRSGRLDPETACGVVLQAASALEKAHTAGIVHRDLKPANIFLVTREDQTAMVKLVDFGIAKVVREENAASGGGLTRTGSAIGTPNYMSPEQAQGLLTLDHRTDVYSLGAVLYEMIVGRPPFPEMPTYEQTILQILTKPVPRASASMPNLPPALDQLVADMMQFQPEQRIGRMREVRERILATFPGLDKARILHAAGTPGTPASPHAALRLSTRPASGEGSVAIASSPGRLSGVATGPTIQAQTNVAVTYDARRGGEEPLVPSGVPARGKTPLVIAGAVLGVAMLIGAVALLRSSPKEASGTHAAVGLVASTLPVGMTAAPTLTPVPEPPPAAAPIVPVEAKPAPAASSEKPGAAAAKNAATPRPASKPTPKERPAKGGTVGGTGISSEF
jgi:serine/threonine-protein kinase